MVGHPKRLEDLERIEAGVRVTCSRCTRERLLDREVLMADLRRRGLSTSWDALRSRLRCACGSKDVQIIAMPFTDGSEDGEALFERLMRAFDAHGRLGQPQATDAAWCRAASDSARELFAARTAMRAWIVARG